MPVSTPERSLSRSLPARRTVGLRTNRIVFLLPNSDEFGGMERHLLHLVGRLLKEDAQIRVVTFGPDVISERFDPEWSQVVLVLTRREPRHLLDWVKLFRELRVDTVVFCYGWIFSFPWQAPVAAMLAGVRKRFAIQHLILPPIPVPYPGNGLYGILRRSLGERARRIYRWRLAAYLCARTICVSNAVREALVDTLRFSPRKTVTIHNGVSTQEFGPSKASREAIRSRLGIGPDEFLLVCSARLSKVKGVNILIKAVSLAVERSVECKCVILGDGPLREDLLRETESLGLQEYVVFLGFQADVRPYLQAASAFILTSYAEGLPLSVLEAMACELPCIVTDVGGNTEVVADGVNGLVIRPGNVDEAANAIIFLAEHPNECAGMARKARETVCQSFDLEQQMNEIAKTILA
jgi:glycosyltransferase involved in cell wall biosynthesis